MEKWGLGGVNAQVSPQRQRDNGLTGLSQLNHLQTRFSVCLDLCLTHTAALLSRHTLFTAPGLCMCATNYAVNSDGL